MSASFSVLRRLANRPDPRPAGERCEMCAEPIGAPHRHVVDVESRHLQCVCTSCYLLFTEPAAALRYRAVPDRYLAFGQTAITTAEWDALEIPVGLAFLFANSAQGRTVAFYPGPAGATESELPAERWRDLLHSHPELDVLAEDVEALLIRMPGSAGRESPGDCLLLPIDTCYEFVGRMRLLWKGFDGGAEARHYIDEFFATMNARARARGGGRP